MQGGVQLSLHIGPVPIAAPREVVDALVHAKVEDGSGDTQSGFELTFELPARSPLRTLFLLSGGGSYAADARGAGRDDQRRRRNRSSTASPPTSRRSRARAASASSSSRARTCRP